MHSDPFCTRNVRPTFCVSNNLDELNQVVSEVEIIEHRDISNAEQLVLVKSINLYKTKRFP